MCSWQQLPGDVTHRQSGSKFDPRPHYKTWAHSTGWCWSEAKFNCNYTIWAIIMYPCKISTTLSHPLKYQILRYIFSVIKESTGVIGQSHWGYDRWATTFNLKIISGLRWSLKGSRPSYDGQCRFWWFFGVSETSCDHLVIERYLVHAANTYLRPVGCREVLPSRRLSYDGFPWSA